MGKLITKARTARFIKRNIGRVFSEDYGGLVVPYRIIGFSGDFEYPIAVVAVTMVGNSYMPLDGMNGMTGISQKIIYNKNSSSSEYFLPTLQDMLENKSDRTIKWIN